MKSGDPMASSDFIYGGDSRFFEAQAKKTASLGGQSPYEKIPKSQYMTLKLLLYNPTTRTVIKNRTAVWHRPISSMGVTAVFLKRKQEKTASLGG